MATSYTVFVKEEAFASLPKSGSQRRLVMDFLRKLRDNPFQRGDYIEPDVLGRPNEVKVVGLYAVVYWADHAVKEVKVMDIKLADR